MASLIEAVRAEGFSIGVYGAEFDGNNEKLTTCLQIFSGCADMHLRLSKSEVERLLFLLGDALCTFEGADNGAL